MKKRVNIYPRGPVISTNPPIRGVVKGVTKDISDIRRCIIAGAKVEEVRPDGQIVLLTLRNYDMDNSTSETTLEGAPINNITELNYAAAVGSEDTLPFADEKIMLADKQAESFEVSISASENAAAIGDSVSVDPDTVEIKPVTESHSKLTKKQRRALRAKEMAAASTETGDDENEEPVETQDAEEM